MAITKAIVLRELKHVLLMAVFGGGLMGYLNCMSCFEEFNSRAIALIILNASFWIFMWKGNEYITLFLNTKISWTQHPGRRFSVGLPLHFTYTIVMSLIIYYCFYVLYLGRDVNQITVNDILGNLVFPVVITLLITTFAHGRSFLHSWRQALVNIEKLKSEQLASQYEALKSQVNPHFLFNSLNVLTSLVHQSPDTAVKFIKKLSDVYRFVLESRKQEVIDLATELRFVKDYLFLQQIRFGDNLRFSIDVLDASLSKMVPPLSIQMLIENAIKHNEISEEHPLTINISATLETIEVVNNLQLKRASEPSSGTGLDNIKHRYEYLSGKKVQIINDESKFLVKLPLLTIDKD